MHRWGGKWLHQSIGVLSMQVGDLECIRPRGADDWRRLER